MRNEPLIPYPYSQVPVMLSFFELPFSFIGISPTPVMPLQLVPGEEAANDLTY